MLAVRSLRANGGGCVELADLKLGETYLGADAQYGSYKNERRQSKNGMLCLKPGHISLIIIGYAPDVGMMIMCDL